MPELPEVEVTRLGLLPFLPGRKVLQIICSSKCLRTPIPNKLLTTHVLGKSIVTVDRRAKYLLVRISDGSTLVLHLGMTGKLGLITAEHPRAKHDHLCLLLDNGVELRFNDSRRFGSVLLWPPEEAAAQEKMFSSRIGVEPFSRKFNTGYLQQQASTRRMPIKNFLMDARIIAGIGNIYANEILFSVSLHPQQAANSIKPDEWKRIITATRRILKQAILAGGSTIADFLGTSGNPGYFQVQFKVYDRAGSPCKKCSGDIVKLVLGGRATYFCPQCQRRRKTKPFSSRVKIPDQK